ncbi:LysM peptidoglycan-binding domain-containing protein [Elioraea sp.]|uniref:LysM peptidoglycan-binding domain-containing protein n=1 Tax=Elioraea sp. TaxID=2185103 RepID=UPI003F6F98B7
MRPYVVGLLGLLTILGAVWMALGERDRDLARLVSGLTRGPDLGQTAPAAPGAAPATTPAAPRPAAPPPPPAAASPPRPSFDIVRLNARGDAVMAGRAAPHADVVVLDGTREIGRVKADDRGEWVFVPSGPMPPGGRELSLRARNPDGTVWESASAVILVVPERDRDVAGRPVAPGSAPPPIALLTPREPGGALQVLQAPRTDTPPADPTPAPRDPPAAAAPAGLEPAPPVPEAVPTQPAAVAPAAPAPAAAAPAAPAVAPAAPPRASAAPASPPPSDDAPASPAAAPPPVAVAPPVPTQVSPTPTAPPASAPSVPSGALAAPRPDPAPRPIVTAPEPAPPPITTAPEPALTAAPPPAPAAPLPRAPSVVAAAPPAIAQGRPPGGVSVDAVDYGPGGDVSFAGRAGPGEAVRLYLDGQHLGDTRADSEGRWNLAPEAPIEPGRTQALRADQVAEDGRVTARVQVPFQRAETPPEGLREGSIIVQPGHSLWRIARETYGRGVRYTVIYEANREQIRNPDLIYPGQVFVLPVERGG